MKTADPDVIEDIAHAIRKLDEVIESTDELTDLTDNFDALASALLPTVTLRRKSKPYRLHEVVQQLGKELDAHKKEQKEVLRLATHLKELTKEIRLAEYGGWLEDDDELLADADEIRELLVEQIKAIFPAIEDVDTDDEDHDETDEADEADETDETDDIES